MMWASSEVQGWRQYMEDAIRIVPSLEAPLKNQALFAVFDGHGGDKVSNIAAREFPKVLELCATSCAERRNTAEGEQMEAEALEESLQYTMLTLDALLRKHGSGRAGSYPGAGPMSQQVAAIADADPDRRNMFNLIGSTAIVALIDFGDKQPGEGPPKRLSVANLGDSRAVLCRAGKLVELSEDQKPENPKEEARIRRAGGHVAKIGPCHRIDGWGLNLSRALGDFHYKSRPDLPPEEQKVSCQPELATLELTEEDEFLVLGCDGCFELLESKDVVAVVRGELQRGRTCEQAVETLLDHCVSDNLDRTRGKGGDNCSAIVIKLGLKSGF